MCLLKEQWSMVQMALIHTWAKKKCMLLEHRRIRMLSLEFPTDNCAILIIQRRRRNLEFVETDAYRTQHLKC